MKSVEKVAVSIPRETLRRFDRLRKRLGRSRSAAVSQALEAWMRGLEQGEADRRYVEAYLRHPERVDDLALVAAEAIAAWEPWE